MAETPDGSRRPSGLKNSADGLLIAAGVAIVLIRYA
jgi:hypothetical protein